MPTEDYTVKKVTHELSDPMRDSLRTFRLFWGDDTSYAQWWLLYRGNILAQSYQLATVQELARVLNAVTPEAEPSWVQQIREREERCPGPSD